MEQGKFNLNINCALMHSHILLPNILNRDSTIDQLVTKDSLALTA